MRDELAELLKTDRSLPEGDARQMAAWDQFDQNAAAPFLDPEWMFGLTTKFDIVIGNPPYVRQEEIKDQKPLLEKHYKGDKDLQGSYSGTADLYIYFIQRSIELLNPGGAFSFITSNKWYRAKYGERLRGWINRQAQIKTVIDFGDAEVFDAIAYPTILVATRRLKPEAGAQNGDVLCVMNWPQGKEKDEVESFPGLMKTLAFDMPQKALTATGWQLEPQAKRGLLDRIQAAGKPLGEYVEGRFYRGILTGFNDAFVIDGPTKDRLIEEHESSRAIIKPFLRGRDIKRWRVEPDDKWLIKIESSENVRHPWSDSAQTKAEAVFAETYPAVHKFMNQFREQLIKRGDQGKFFWELRSCAYWKAFEKPKIIYPDIYEHQSFAWEAQGLYAGNTGYFIPTSERWIAGVLNSLLIEWFYLQISNSIRGGYLRSFSDYMKQIPIPNSATSLQRTLIDAVIGVQIYKQDSRLEQLLNGFVYELFFKNDLHAKGLTIFAEAEQAGLSRLAGLEGEALVKAATTFAATNLIPGARLQTMLTDLQTLDTVRIIEGKE